MGWSIRLGRILGIDIYVHLTFFLLLAYIVFANYMKTRDWSIALWEMGFITIAFAIVVMHEYGHALAARAFGVGTHDITLLPIGGVARLERIPENPVQELIIAVAGPAVNVVLAATCFVGLIYTGQPLFPTGNELLIDGSLLQRLFLVNVGLVVFNMIPAFPMDGGRVLRALLAMATNRVQATQIAATVGQLFALLLGFLGLFGAPLLVFVALFVWIGAAQEAADVAQRSSLAGVPVRTAMISQYQTVSPLDTLADVARKVLASFQQDFPVVEHERVVGMITRRDLLEALSSSGHEAVVASAMQAEFATAAPQEMLNDVIGRLQAASAHTLPVIENGRLIGLLTSENVSELLMVRSAIAQASRG